MYCRQCGSELPDDSTFCGNCGARQDGPASSASQNGEQTPPPHYSQPSPKQPGIDYPVSNQGKIPGVDYPVDQPKKKKKGKGCLISALAAVVVIVLAVVFIGGDDPIEKLQADTIKLADTYKEAQIMSYKVMNTDNTQVDYDTWYKGMEKTCQLWQDVEEQSAELEKTCDKAIAKAEKQQAWLERGEKMADIFLTDEAMAVTRQEINAVFDAAPAGKGIKTLAKFLGTDAKTAWGVFQSTQAEIAKEAYATEKFYEKCETAATVVKDASKVGLFAGGLVLSGGTAASFTALESAGIVAGGTDLILELYQDGAAIAYGANDDITATCADFRKGTKPVAAILGLQNLAGNAFEQLTYLSDSMLGLFQDDEVVGINIKGSKDKPTVQLTGMKKDELAGWANENGLNTETNGTAEDLKLTPADVQDVDVDAPDSTPADDVQPADSQPKDNTSAQATDTQQNSAPSEDTNPGYSGGIVGEWTAFEAHFTDDQLQSLQDLGCTDALSIYYDQVPDYRFDANGSCYVLVEVNNILQDEPYGTYEFDVDNQQGEIDHGYGLSRLTLQSGCMLRMEDHVGGVIYCRKSS